MNGPRIILLGTGSLATAIVHALAASGFAGARIYICGRSLSACKELATQANALSTANGNNPVFIPEETDWTNDSSLTDIIRKIAPEFVIHTASLQSMWDLKAENSWSQLIRSVGYGGTLPLQCKLARKVAIACTQVPAPPVLINCCYPDAVNAVLTSCGLSVFSGIGNIGIIEQALSVSENRMDNYLMLANHFHVQQLFLAPEDRTEWPRVWVGEEEYDPRRLFDAIQLVNEPSLNLTTAITCINLLKAVVQRSDCTLHLPGPEGMIGGYPVHFRSGKIASIGTGKMSSAEEQEWNSRILMHEGAVIEKSGVRFTEDAREKIGRYSSELAQGFAYEDIDDYVEAFIRLKGTLQTAPAKQAFEKSRL